MFPDKNLDECDKVNKHNSIIGPTFGIETEYVTFVQSRINTNLLLMSNPNLIKELGLDYEKILEETRNLFQVASYVEIPDPVKERR